MEVRVLGQVLKILESESIEIKKKIQDILEKLELGLPVGMPHVKSLSSIHRALFEIRVKDRDGQFRVIYFIYSGREIFLVHAFRKKTEKISKREIEIIKKRLKGLNYE